MAPALYPSVVTHVRTRPSRNAFKHRTYLWLVDLDRLPRLPGPLRPLARFEGRDHFAGRDPGIRASLERFLAACGEDLDGGQVLMLGNARVFGHVFNPLTLFWCHGPDGVPRCVVAEVHNTFGERHCYLLRPGQEDGAAVARELGVAREADDAKGAGDAKGASDAKELGVEKDFRDTKEFRVAKDFYVSPFFAVEGDYRMRLPLPDERLGLTVHLEQDGSRPFTATVVGRRRPATPWQLLRTLARHPWPTLAVTVAIRWHGIRLWLRRLPVVPRPHHSPQKGMQ